MIFRFRSRFRVPSNPWRGLRLDFRTRYFRTWHCGQSGLWFLEVGFWTLDLVMILFHRTEGLDFGFWIFTFWILDLASWILEYSSVEMHIKSGSWILDLGYCSSASFWALWNLLLGSWILGLPMDMIALDFGSGIFEHATKFFGRRKWIDLGS